MVDPCKFTGEETRVLAMEGPGDIILICFRRFRGGLVMNSVSGRTVAMKLELNSESRDETTGLRSSRQSACRRVQRSLIFRSWIAKYSGLVKSRSPDSALTDSRQLFVNFSAMKCISTWRSSEISWLMMRSMAALT